MYPFIASIRIPAGSLPAMLPEESTTKIVSWGNRSVIACPDPTISRWTVVSVTRGLGDPSA